MGQDTVSTDEAQGADDLIPDELTIEDVLQDIRNAVGIEVFDPERHVTIRMLLEKYPELSIRQARDRIAKLVKDGVLIEVGHVTGSPGSANWCKAYVHRDMLDKGD